MNAHAIWLAIALAAAPLGAQDKAAKNASTRLHAAWLREMIDLDVDGAVADYRSLVNDFPTAPERWIAIARLEELRRVGVRVGPPVAVADAPPEIKRALAKLTPLPAGAEELRRQALAGPVLHGEGVEPPLNLELRPASTAAEVWVNNNSGLTLDERQIQRMQAQFRGGGNRGYDQRMTYAIDVLTAELDGRLPRAKSLRGIYFQNWKELAPKGEPAALLARARTNLEAWLESMQQSQQPLFNRLLEEIKTTANPATTLAMLQRVPIIGERLLADPAPNSGANSGSSSGTNTGK